MKKRWGKGEPVNLSDLLKITPVANEIMHLTEELDMSATDVMWIVAQIIDNGKEFDSEAFEKVFNENDNSLSYDLDDIDLDIEKSILMRLEDGTYVLEVAVDVKVLEIFLEIEQDEWGEPTGNLILGPGYEVLEYYPPEEEPTAPPVIDEPDDPEQPDQPDTPEPPKDKPGGGGGSGGRPNPGVGSLTVYSTGVSGSDYSQPPKPAAQINIFGSNKHIAPGMTGTYRFTVDNEGNDFAVYYDINLAESNNALNIPMRYRLMNNQTKSYVTGDTGWHTPAEINQATADPDQPLSMKEKSQNTYTLEWFWDDRGQIDNSWGEKHAGEVVCTLTIKVSAQRI
jgi:hypothetical protein